MDEHTREHIFEPFFTTKPHGKGTGLGLASVQGIVAQSEGCIFVDSLPRKGTTFRVWFPQARAESVAAIARRAQAVTPTRAVRTITKPPVVLVVEDEPAVRQLIQRVLSTRGYTVLTAQNASSALLMVEERANDVQAVVCDVVLPGLSGPDLARELRRRNPEVGLVFMSGYSPEAVAQHGVIEPGSEFLNKPFTPAQLIEALERVLGRAETAAPR